MPDRYCAITVKYRLAAHVRPPPKLSGQRDLAVANRGCELVKLEGIRAAPVNITPALDALGLGKSISITHADNAQLIATIRSPHGIHALTS